MPTPADEAIASSTNRVDGRPRAAPPQLGEQWLPFEKIRAILHLAAVSNLSSIRIDEPLQLPHVVVTTVLSKDPDHAPLLGLARTAASRRKPPQTAANRRKPPQTLWSFHDHAFLLN